MGVEYTLLILVTLLGVALLLIPPLARIGLSSSAVLVGVGFLGSEVVVAGGGDTGIRWNQFHGVILYVLLPVLIFEGALTLDTRLLRRNLGAIVFLAMPLMLVVAAAVGGAMYLAATVLAGGVGVVAAAMTGVLLAGTDTSAIERRLARTDVPRRLAVLAAGESNFNDAMSVVLFSALVGAALASDVPSLVLLPGALLATIAGGLLAGAAATALARVVLPRVDDQLTCTMSSLVLVYVTYIVADAVLRVSGVMALLVLGGGVGWLLRRHLPQASAVLPAVWAYKSRIASSFAFLLLGITVHVQMFQDHWRLMLIGIVILAAARVIAWLLLTPLLRWVPGAEPIPLAAKPALIASGVPGAVSIALVLSLPLEFQGWYTVQCIVYGAVLFYLLVQLPLVEWALRRLGGRASKTRAAEAS